MRILHGTWIPNEETDFIQSGSFYLWVETQLSQKSHTNSQQIHPGHLLKSELIAFLVQELGREQCDFVRLAKKGAIANHLLRIS